MGASVLVAPTKRHSPFGSIFQMRAQLTCKQMQAQQSRTADSSLFRHYWHVLIGHYSRGSWWGNIITGCWCEVIECNHKNGPWGWPCSPDVTYGAILMVLSQKLEGRINESSIIDWCDVCINWIGLDVKWKQDEYHAFMVQRFNSKNPLSPSATGMTRNWNPKPEQVVCLLAIMLFILFYFPIPLLIPAPPLKHQTPPLPPFRLLFPRWSLWYPDLFKLSCRRTRPDWDQQAVVVVVVVAQIWDAAAAAAADREGGSIKAAAAAKGRKTEKKERRISSLEQRLDKMNSFILLSLFAAVISGKSPRLKFVVHGRQLLFSLLLTPSQVSPSRFDLIDRDEYMNGWMRVDSWAVCVCVCVQFSPLWPMLFLSFAARAAQNMSQ